MKQKVTSIAWFLLLSEWEILIMKFLARAINTQSDLYKYYFNILYSNNLFYFLCTYLFI